MSAELSHTFRCPDCNGLNDLDARWCMQCARPFQRPEDPERSLPGAEEELEDESPFSIRGILSDAVALVSSRETSSDLDKPLARTFAVANDRVMWTCIRCSTINDIKDAECSQCGRSFAASARVVVDDELPQKQSRSIYKAFGYVMMGLVVMRLVADLISPWAAAAVLGGAFLRFLFKYLR